MMYTAIVVVPHLLQNYYNCRRRRRRRAGGRTRAYGDVYIYAVCAYYNIMTSASACCRRFWGFTATPLGDIFIYTYKVCTHDTTDRLGYDQLH